MNKKKLIGLAVALAVLVLLALVQQGGKLPKSVEKTKKIGETMLEGIDLNAVAKVGISQGSNSVELAKQEGKWVVKSLFNYPADFPKLAEGLRQLAQVKSGSPVRASNVDPSEFGLDDDAKMVVLSSAAGETLASLEVGARREASREAGWANQHFVRLGGNDAVLLVDHDFREFAESSNDWIKRELLNIPSDDVVSVKVSGMELKVDGADWKLVGLNEETEELQNSEADKLRRALSFLNCTSVADPAKSDKDLGFDSPVEYVAETKSTNTCTVVIGGEADGGRYARITASDEELNKKLSGWTYIISNYDADDMLLTRDKLVKEKEKPAEEEKPEAGPAEEPASDAME
ncbi:MAG: DUF4340 domain-containing protein [Kiritimatiellales bacterium]|nr:DUF4340 domain-containing protein [Kiritimatiellales bacterium]